MQERRIRRRRRGFQRDVGIFENLVMNLANDLIKFLPVDQPFVQKEIAVT